jgi:hypothetical protein
MLKRNNIAILPVLFAVFLAAVPADLESQEIPQFRCLENGIIARIHEPEAIMDNMTRRDADGRLIFEAPGGASYILIEDISDPAIFNKGDGSFHAFDLEHVASALREIEVGGAPVEIEVEIYILPLPRRFLLSSSTVGTTIFLSPGVFEPGYELTAYTVTHEFGHCVQENYLPEGDAGRWNEYMSLRDILDEDKFRPTAAHADRPREIFAEDFRFLFGGEAARYSGTIENPELPLPTEVRGLDEFIVSLVSTVIAGTGGSTMPGAGGILALSSYPNPFNPATTIRVDFEEGTAGDEAEISVYGADGRLVRRLYRGGVAGDRLEVAWDGRNDGGSPVGSGVYFYSVRRGGILGTGKMIMLK